jgi:hypothetical protein
MDDLVQCIEEVGRRLDAAVALYSDSVEDPKRTESPRRSLVAALCLVLVVAAAAVVMRVGGDSPNIPASSAADMPVAFVLPQNLHDGDHPFEGWLSAPKLGVVQRYVDAATGRSVAVAFYSQHVGEGENGTIRIASVTGTLVRPADTCRASEVHVGDVTGVVFAILGRPEVAWQADPDRVVILQASGYDNSQATYLANLVHPSAGPITTHASSDPGVARAVMDSYMVSPTPSITTLSNEDCRPLVS